MGLLWSIMMGEGEAMHGRRTGHTFVFVEHGPKYLIV